MSGKRERARFVKQVRGELLALNREYDPEGDGAGIDERFEAKLQALLVADNQQATAERIRDSFQIHLLSDWAKKKIDGKPSVLMYQRKAKRARSLAKMLEKKGDQAAARAQLTQALEFEKMASEFLTGADSD